MKIFKRGTLALLLLAGQAIGEEAPVTVNEHADTVTLDNGILSATVKKANGNILSLRLRGTELMSRGGGYWNVYGCTPGQPKTERKPGAPVFRITQNPADNAGARGEVSIRFPYQGETNTVPLDIEIRYTLHRGATGLYAWTIVDHDPAYPPFNIEISTLCLKLSPEVFDFLSVDKDRQRQMATGEDWVNGTQLNLWEARRLNTGIHKGAAEHKYDYAAMFSRTPAYGWSSTQRNVGIYMVNPSLEYINGAPVMTELTGHIDVKPRLPANPTLLFIWHGPHYGGRNIQIGAQERWQKIVGPFLLYCNEGDSPRAMWEDALARAAVERQAWPYAWAEAPGYAPRSQRGGARGSLVVADPQAPDASAAGAWVGLAAPPYPAQPSRDATTEIDWQTDGKHYQYWAQADSQGRFSIPHARPGSYTLYAFTDGVLGTFSRADIRIEAGQTTELGELVWVPERHGRQLWQIGIPNRSAEEFRHGDHYWQWGLYERYPQEFPDDVDFVIGKSDWRQDWNYVQPPRPNGRGGWSNTTWRIRFNLDAVPQGTAVLRLAICGVRGGPVEVSVNGRPVGGTGPLPDSGVMHRDGIRSASLTERHVKFDASALVAGENVIALTKKVRAWTDGVLYDCVRLELEESQP